MATENKLSSNRLSEAVELVGGHRYTDGSGPIKVAA